MQIGNLEHVLFAGKDKDYSVSELREMLGRALKLDLNPVSSDGPAMASSVYAYVQEIFPSSLKFVYSMNGKNYLRSYSVKNGNVSLANDARPARQKWMEASGSKMEGTLQVEKLRNVGTSEGAKKGWENRPQGLSKEGGSHHDRLTKAGYTFHKSHDLNEGIKMHVYTKQGAPARGIHHFPSGKARLVNTNFSEVKKLDGE